MTARSNKKAWALTTTLAVFWALVIPLVGTSAANHGTRTLNIGHCSTDGAPPCADADADMIANETVSNQITTTHTMRAVLSAAADAGSGDIEIDFEIASGPGDISGGGNGAGNTPNSPDLTCTVLVASNSCEVSYSSSSVGTDTIRGWIDHDKNDAIFEGDATEGRNAADCDENEAPNSSSLPQCVPIPGESEPGATAEPDLTDVVEKTWTVGPPAIVDCDPETATNPATGTGSAEAYTCTVTDSQGNPANGVRIDGENKNGKNDPDNADAGPADYNNLCQTNSSGTCSGNVNAIDAEAGPATICFWGDLDNDAAYDPAGSDQTDGGDCDMESQGQADDDLTDTVTKTWEARSSANGGLDAEAETANRNLTENATITGSVYDQFGALFVSATTVNLEFFTGSPSDTDGNTPASPDKTCTTNNASSCVITYTQLTTQGVDLACLWINSAPTMAGNNATGTCDGGGGAEALTDADDDPAGPDAPAPANDDVDLVQRTWVNPNAATKLDCTPETDANPTGTAHAITCTAQTAADDPVEAVNIDVEAVGANDPDAGETRDTPDFTCLTAATGMCTVTHGPAGTSNVGTTTYRAWIDLDDNDATDESDATEGRAEGTTPGAEPEVDDTDVVEKTWGTQPTTITMTPDSDSSPVGQCNAFTIEARDVQNAAVQGATLAIEQQHELAANQTNSDEPTVSFCTPDAADGPNPSGVDETAGDLRPPDEAPDNVGTAGGETTGQTDANGQVTIGISIAPGNGSDGTGTVTVDAFFDVNGNDDADAGDPKDTSIKTWVKAQARTIDCTPKTATNQTGTQHVVDCIVRDAFDGPVAGELVTFTESGPGSLIGTVEVQTDAQGRATATTTSSQAGTQTITGTIKASTENEPDIDECDRSAGDPTGAPVGKCSDSVTKTWEAPSGPACNDGADNDGDGATDFPDDSGCTSSNDDNEDDSIDPQCGNPGVICGTDGPDILVGGPGDDIIIGGDGDDTCDGQGGNDVIFCGGGDDTIIGGPGDDVLRSKAGKDTIKGGSGDDILRGGGDDDVLRGGSGSDILRGGGGNDSLVGGGQNDLVIGGAGNDSIKGNKGSDTLRGGGGRDTLQGGSGNDILRGGKGKDTLKGGKGNDTLNGGGGKDSCGGGQGKDKLRKCE